MTEKTSRASGEKAVRGSGPVAAASAPVILSNEPGSFSWGVLAKRHPSLIQQVRDAFPPFGPRKCFEARVERVGRKPLVGRFGGIPLRQNKKTVITDRRLAPVNIKRKELVTRLLAGRCEACGRVDEVEVHHVAKLADLGKPGTDRPPWADLMAARHRKALVVCGSCHADIHGKKPVPTLTE
ncbi:HNH endonuclease [Streptomyces atratus]|uniref:HNH endonuclease n=1 Tax=Streptomyces atratus TaxID=1893 RepID=UPI002AC3622D|nr:hypothetical protein [Streptomyces atratus]